MESNPITDNKQAETAQELAAKFAGMGLDEIKKPRTQFSTNALKRVTKHVDLASKIQTISLNKVNIVSRLNLSTTQGLIEDKKIRTVGKLPKVMSLDSRMIDKELPSKKQQKRRLSKGLSFETQKELVEKSKIASMQQIPEIAEKIEEMSVKDEDEKKDDDDDESAGESDDDEDSGESSIDMDGDDDEKLYDQFLNLQKDNASLKNAQSKGSHLDDLVDAETINLLKLCNSLHKPKDKADTLQAKQVKFGENEGKLKTLVLDMDETMLHAKFIADQSELANDDGNFVFTLQSEESGSKDIGGRPSESMQISVKMRPYLDMALDFLSKYYEICVFTAGTQDYADACLDFLDPERKVIRHRLYRQHCVNPCSGVYVKDLRIISDRNLKDIIIVDNSIISFAYQMNNGIPIKAYVRQETDEELLYMVAYLEEIFSLDDPRESIRKTFCLQDLMNRHCVSKV